MMGDSARRGSPARGHGARDDGCDVRSLWRRDGTGDDHRQDGQGEAEVTVTLLKSKLHRLRVTESDLDYTGSLTIDEDLMDAVGIMNYERLLVANVANGKRFETYAIRGPRGSGV